MSGTSPHTAPNPPKLANLRPSASVDSARLQHVAAHLPRLTAPNVFLVGFLTLFCVALPALFGGA